MEHVADYMELDQRDFEVNTVDFMTGRNEIHLKDNIVSIGLASSFIEPLESTGIYLIISSLERLVRYIDGEMTEEEYNQHTNDGFDAIINFIAAHYKYSKRDNEYWNHYKNLEIDQYLETDIFPKEAWDYILSGFGLAQAPKSTVNPRDLIKIHKGTQYHEWIKNASNTT
jgi:hypothetical protein